VVITKFIEGAHEIELDAVACRGRIVNYAVSEHVENAGVHSGDAHLIFPAGLPREIQERVRGIGAKLAKALEISGPFNVQFIEKDGDIGVIEVNLRSSRSFPFVSKALNVDFIKTASRIFLGDSMEPDPGCDARLAHVSVKAPQFSYARLPGSDPVLGVEMASTGEVACYGQNRYEAYLKAIISAGFRVPRKAALLSGDIRDDFAPLAQKLVAMGLEIVATPEAQETLKKAKLPFKTRTHQEVFAAFKKKEIDLVINFPYATDKTDDMRLLRRAAVDFAVPIITNRQIAAMTITSMETVGNDFTIKGWDEYFDSERNVELDNLATAARAEAKA